MNRIFYVAGIALLLSHTACKQTKEPIAKNTDWKKLSLREKIGQTMMVQATYQEHMKIGGDSLEVFFEKYPIGAFFMAQWNFTWPEKPANLNTDFIPNLMKIYDSASPRPLFFSEDFERGAGYGYTSATKLPAEMALGAAQNTDLAYDYSQIMSQEVRAMGFNWLLNPVADLNMNPLHPLVIERAISDNAERTIPILQAQTRAMREHGVIATIKHFPGDGATICDQHEMTSANNLSLNEWKKTFGKVFQTMIDQEIPSIMVGHIQFPAYQNDAINGVLPPATLSKDIMTKLLKQEMGYKGVVISDAMNMGGVSGYYDSYLEAAVQCFVAGADMILWPDLAYMDTVEARINRGEIPMSRLDDAVERIWALREKYDLLEKKTSITTPLPENHAEFVQTTMTQLANEAITLIQDKGNVIPLDTASVKRIMLINISHKNHSGTFQILKNELLERGFDEVRLEHNIHRDEWGWKWDTAVMPYDKFIVCFENKYLDPLGSPLLKDREAYALWTIKDLPKDKVISISFSNPYYNTFYLKTTPLLMNAYSSDEFMQRAAARLLMGEIKATATSPVNLYNPIMR
ncbi:MAG: glycoside hydrolase family 3 protein [Bacteroidales bacterium]|jgi:beta-N-acetylhexosaminidase|nr:glycoside hydrolase family 3 protein [Bacteroidales bacterium]